MKAFTNAMTREKQQSCLISNILSQARQLNGRIKLSARGLEAFLFSPDSGLVEKLRRKKNRIGFRH
jgi:hypothetical protein